MLTSDESEASFVTMETSCSAAWGARSTFCLDLYNGTCVYVHGSSLFVDPHYMANYNTKIYHFLV